MDVKKKKKTAFFSAARISATLQAGQGGPLIKKHTYKIFIHERYIFTSDIDMYF